MKLHPNLEGIQYILGIPLAEPQCFSQVVLHPGEVEGLPADVMIRGFENLDQARRVRHVVQSRCNSPLSVYEVRIQRLQI